MTLYKVQYLIFIYLTSCLFQITLFRVMCAIKSQVGQMHYVVNFANDMVSLEKRDFLYVSHTDVTLHYSLVRPWYRWRSQIESIYIPPSSYIIWGILQCRKRERFFCLVIINVSVPGLNTTSSINFEPAFYCQYGGVNTANHVTTGAQTWTSGVLLRIKNKWYNLFLVTLWHYSHKFLL